MFAFEAIPTTPVARSLKPRRCAGPIWDWVIPENAMTLAVVAKKSPHGLQFLTSPAPAIAWSRAAHLATRFPDVRSATRAALTLKAHECAFALPTAGLLGAR